MTVEVTYVLGLGRSGTTVFGRALAARQGAAPVDELMAVWQRGVLEDRVCSCGVPFSTCPHWRAVVATSPRSFDRDTAERVVAQIHHLMAVLGPRRVWSARTRARLVASVPRAWFDATAALYQGVAAVEGGTPLVDTSKAPVLAWLLAHCPGVRVRTTLLVRDPRAVARSWSRPPSLPSGAHELPVLVPWQVAVVWLLCNVAGERVHAALGGDADGIARYEDFVADPRAVLARVSSGAVSVAGSDAVVERGPAPSVLVVPTAAHTMSGHPAVRFAGDEVAVRTASSAPAAPSGSDRVVALIDGPVLARFGYSIGGPS